MDSTDVHHHDDAAAAFLNSATKPSTTSSSSSSSALKPASSGTATKAPYPAAAVVAAAAAAGPLMLDAGALFASPSFSIGSLFDPSSVSRGGREGGREGGSAVRGSEFLFESGGGEGGKKGGGAPFSVSALPEKKRPLVPSFAASGTSRSSGGSRGRAKRGGWGG